MTRSQQFLSIPFLNETEGVSNIIKRDWHTALFATELFLFPAV